MTPRPSDPTATVARRALAAAVAVLTALALVLVAPTVAGAQEAGPQLTFEPATDLDPAGQDVVVTGTGYPTDGPGVYVLYGPEVTAETDTADAAPYGAFAFVPSALISDDGEFSVTLEDVAATYTDDDDVDRDFTDGGGFISTFRAHGVPDPVGAWLASEPVTFAAPELPASTTTLTASSPSVSVDDDVILTAHVRDAGGANVTDGTVEVRAGDTVLGSAVLEPNGRATVIASFATPGTRQVTARFSGNDAVDPSTSGAVAIAVTAATSPPPDDPADEPDIAPSGTRTGTGRAGQTITATPVDNLDPAGTEVTVTGTGFTPAAGFEVDEHGLYLGFCVDRGPNVAPSPCVGGVDMSGESSTSRWISNNPYPGVQDVVSVTPDGTWSTTITIQARDDLVDCLDPGLEGRCVLTTRMDHRASGDRTQDVKVPVCFAGEAECAVEPIATDPSSGPAPFTGYALDPLATGAGWAGRPTTLAATGSATWGLTATGIGLAAVGLALVMMSRRRRAALLPVPAAPRARPSRPTPGDPS